MSKDLWTQYMTPRDGEVLRAAAMAPSWASASARR